MQQHEGSMQVDWCSIESTLRSSSEKFHSDWLAPPTIMMMFSPVHIQRHLMTWHICSRPMSGHKWVGISITLCTYGRYNEVEFLLDVWAGNG